MAAQKSLALLRRLYAIGVARSSVLLEPSSLAGVVREDFATALGRMAKKPLKWRGHARRAPEIPWRGELGP